MTCNKAQENASKPKRIIFQVLSIHSLFVCNDQCLYLFWSILCENPVLKKKNSLEQSMQIVEKHVPEISETFDSSFNYLVL